MLPKSILAATIGLFTATSLQAGVQIRFMRHRSLGHLKRV